MLIDPILADAQRLPVKEPLLKHKRAVLLLRTKGYTWREISDFLRERGVSADHTTLSRLFKGASQMVNTTTVPTAQEYVAALENLKISEIQMKMLLAHYAQHNRSITYTQLGQAAGYATNKTANSEYGSFGHALGDALGFTFVDLNESTGTKFYSSAIGMGNQYAEGEFQIVMHHELAKALEQLKWV